MFKSLFLVRTLAQLGLLILSGTLFSCRPNVLVQGGKANSKNPDRGQFASPTPSATASTLTPKSSNALTSKMAISLTESSLTVSEQSIQIGKNVELTLTLRDAQRNILPLSGLTVEWRQEVGYQTSQGTIGTTKDHLNGSYSVSFSATKKGRPVLISAQIAGYGTFLSRALITVTNTPPVLTPPSNRTFPISGTGGPAKQNSDTNYTFTTLVSDADNDGVNLSCTFQTIGLSASDPNYATSGTLCTTLPSIMTTSGLDLLSTASFSGQTLTWKPTNSQRGTYLFTITGSDGDSQTVAQFYVSVRPNFTYNNYLLSSFEAVFSDIYSTLSNSAPARPRLDGVSNSDDTRVWLSEIGSWQGSLTGFSSTAPWSGTGTYASPYQLTFTSANSDSLNLGSNLNGKTKVAISSWISPSNIALTNKTLFNNSDGAGNGFLIEQSSTANTIELSRPGATRNYPAVVTLYTPIAYWKFDETSGSTAGDSSGNALDITLSGGFTVNSTGGVTSSGNKALAFDGVNAAGSLNYNATLSPTNALSVSVWFKSSDLTRYQYLLSNFNGSGGYALIANGTGGGNCINAVCFLIYAGGTWNYTPQYAISNFSNNTWYHLVGVFDGKNTQLFVNGKLVSSTYIGSTTISYGAARTLCLGNSTNNNCTTDNYYFQGSMDDLAIYNTALSYSAIRDLYTAGLSGCRTNLTLSNNLWVQVSALLSGTTATLFLNGQPQCTLNYTESFASNTTNLNIGGTGGTYWSGSIGDIKVYGSSDGSVVATSSSIKSDFEATANPYRNVKMENIVLSGIVYALDAAYTKLGLSPNPNGCAADDLYPFDLSPNSIFASLTLFSACGATSGWNGDGSVTSPYRITFDGTNDYVAVENHSDLNPTAISMEAWVRATDTANTGNFMSKGGNSGYRFRLGNASGAIIFYDQGTTRLATGNLTFNQWTHIVVTSDSTGSKLYINGTNTDQNSFAYSAPVTGSYLTIGGDIIYGEYFKGDIAIARVYNRSLSISEVKQNCLAAEPRFTSTPYPSSSRICSAP